MRLPQAMGSGPLTLPFFYQYRCTHVRVDPPCCNGSAEISAIQDRWGTGGTQPLPVALDGGRWCLAEGLSPWLRR